MLRLLLDEQISPKVVEAFRPLSSTSILSLRDYDGGRLMGAEDEIVLEAASAAALTLVTYDVGTIGPLLVDWAEQNRSHSGVIFIKEATISSANFGAIARALAKVAKNSSDVDWTNLAIFLQR